jgi:hypothetical protein
MAEEFFMGQRLTQQELPPNVPRPARTPAEGVIVTDIAPDGWSRRYLYMAGPERTPEEIMISETPPSGQPIEGPGRPRAMGVRIMGGLIKPQNLLQRRSLPIVRMGQAVAPGPVPQPPPPPPPAEPTAPPGTCPGPVQMPDGRVVKPEDGISLKDLCEIMPLLLDAYRSAAGLARGRGGPGAPGAPPYGGPGGPIPLTGGPPGSPMPGGFPSFGPGTGTFGGGGGGGGGGGPIPGPLGPIQGVTPLNPNQGPPGPPGPPGPGGGGGTVADFVVKTDGDFTAGPGSFIPVPGTLLNFVQGADGAVVFLINAVFGCGQTTNDALAIRIDGTTVIPLQVSLFHTFVGGVGGFYQDATASWPMILPAGPHTVEIMLRGIGAGEFCGGAGFGFPATLGATPATPLTLTAFHQGAGAPAPGAAVLVIDGVVKTDGDFTNIGAIAPVPGTSFTFNVAQAGRATITISANFVAAPFSSLPQIQFGISIDGVNIELVNYFEQQGAGMDKVFRNHFSATYMATLAPGPHTVQMLYGSGAAAPGPMVLEANSAHAAVITATHT